MNKILALQNVTPQNGPSDEEAFPGTSSISGINICGTGGID
ncbi:hypothetical protein [Streptomyces sp. NPDC092952]